ncbi:unnamed protein product [Nezara viridula]|uniref:Cytokine-like nuclear factor N-PAC n=1 Tax=Nezara viridula TaxID=85310 RepID=A0A9P0E7E2_NEZVI|nr:unnamed protein product [Nezara viridula]
MSFEIGDLVWAKMKGFPPWPGLVSHPPDGLMDETLLKNDVKYSCIYFFGTHNYGFIEHAQLKEYMSNKVKMSKMSKAAKFKLACSEIEEHYQKNKSTEDETVLTNDGIEAETKPSGIGDETIGNLYPRIELHKLHGIEDFLPISDIPKSDSSKGKRVLPPTKKMTKKRKYSNYFHPDTTTPLDAMCEIACHPSSDPFSKEETSIHSSDEHSGEEEHEEKEPMNDGSLDEMTDISSGEIAPCTIKIGFLGGGIMGKTLIQRLLQDGHEIILWNRSPEKLTDFQNIGVRIATSPAEVVIASEFIFCCVADGKAAKQLMFSHGGVIMHMTPEKSFIDLSSSDVQSSLDMSEAVFSIGSRYLEVRLHGTKKDAENGNIICLSAGDESLYNDCQFFYQSCSKQSFFMGETGNASRLYLIIESVAGVALAGLGECMALADRAGLDPKDVLEIIKISQINCPLIVEKATAMVNSEYSTSMSLKNMQNNLQSVIAMGEEIEQPTPVTATTNEIFKHAKKVGYGGHDVSAVFLSSKF